MSKSKSKASKGKANKGEESKGKESMRPICYWTASVDTYTELLHRVSAVAVVDLTAEDAVRTNIPNQVTET